MKIIKKSILLAILAFSAGLVYGMEKQENRRQEDGLKLPNTYKGQPITSKTLPSMIDEVPTEIKDEIDTYQKDHPGRIKWLARVDLSKGLANFSANRHYKALALAQSIGHEDFNKNPTENISNHRHNYILPTNKGVIQISGENNRIMGMLVSHPERPITRDSGVVMGDFNRNPEFRQNAFNKIIQKPVATYQTASRAAAALVVNELGFKDVQAPKTYIMPVDGEQLTSIADNDCFVVQEYIKDAKPLDAMTAEEIKEIDPKTMANYATVLTNAGLFTPRVLVKDDVLYLVDLEQPNNFNGNLFRYQPSEDPRYATNHTNEYLNSVGAGWREIPSSILQVSEHKRALAEVFATNNNIQELRKQGHFGDIENKLKES